MKIPGLNTMVRIKPFEVENWMDDHETICKYNLGETCCDSISLSQLLSLSTSSTAADSLDLSSMRLDYGAIPGSLPLRTNLASIYSTPSSPLSPNNILTTPGAIMANFLFLYTHVGPGDHVVCQHPTYQQLYSVPESLGAEVTLWRTGPDDGWVLDVGVLEGMLKPETKVIILNNPQNPTGAVISKEKLEAIVAIAKPRNIIIMTDEVYRPLFHSTTPPPSILSLGYINTVSTGSMSKAYSLAGIRVGWIATRNPEIWDRCYQGRNYTTISVSKLSERIAEKALAEDTRVALLQRNLELARRNLAILKEFVEGNEEYCDWTPPLAGTTAFIRFHHRNIPVDDVAFCEASLKDTGVLFVPGGLCFGDGERFEGFMRVGFCADTETLRKGLEEVGRWLRERRGLEEFVRRR